jgi:heme/copper-type cytochrome/quinol oxidase subunit 2
MSEENSTGTNLIWAITMIIIVAIIAGALYYTVIRTGNDKTKDINIKVDVPASKPN